MDDRVTIALVLGFAVALAVIGGGFWFLYEAFLDVNTAALPENGGAGAVVVAITGMMSASAGWVFATVTMILTGRISAAASKAGAEHALAQPGDKP